MLHSSGNNIFVDLFCLFCKAFYRKAEHFSEIVRVEGKHADR